MNEKNLQSQVESLLPKNLKPTLNVLHEQTENFKAVPAPTTPITKGTELQKPIRTYESDVAEAIAKQKASTITMAIAENEKRVGAQKVERAEERSTSQTGKKIFLTLISIIFIGSGLAVGYYIYMKNPLTKEKVAIPTITIPGVVSADVQKIVSIKSLNQAYLVDFFSKEFMTNQVEAGKILELIPAQAVGSSSVKLTASKFIDTIKFEMLDTLKRSLTDKWMIGMYKVEEGGTNIPFIIFTTDFFQNAFAGMLKWEQTMPDELAVIFNYRDRLATGIFEDKIVRNRDVREFRAENGEMLLLYTFIDKDNILITTSEEVIPDIIDRIEKQTYIR